jgi:RNA polymerase sigma-70 factor (sigma-E family)
MGSRATRRDEGADPSEELLARLFRDHYTGLVRLACVLVDDRESGEEIVQDAFVRLHINLDRVRDVDAVPAYLRSIVLNLARSRLRRRRVGRRHQMARGNPGTSLEDLAALREDQREVISALRTLPPRQQQCLVLRYYAELTEGEIATALGISTGSVKTHTSRGRAALAERLEALQ